MKIRKANITDVIFIVNLLQKICTFHSEGRGDIFKPQGKKYDFEGVAALIERNDIFIDIAVAEDGDRLGYCIQRLRDFQEDDCRLSRKTLYVDDLCVKSNVRSNGIGTELMQSAKNRAKRLGCATIELNVWDFNKAAMRFYDKLGFVPQRHIFEFKLKKG